MTVESCDDQVSCKFHSGLLVQCFFHRFCLLVGDIKLVSGVVRRSRALWSGRPRLNFAA